MLLPERRDVVLWLEPGELAALGLAVDAGVALGEQDLGPPIAIDIADRNQRRDVIDRDPVLLPGTVIAPVLVPIGACDQLVLPVAVQVGDRQPLLMRPQASDDRARLGPRTTPGILDER